MKTHLTLPLTMTMPLSNIVPLNIVMEQLSNMKYFCNEPARSGAEHGIAKHEHAIENIFIDNGHLESTKWCKTNEKILSDNRKELKKWLNKGMCDGEDALLDIIPPGTYVSQPLGSQNNPDFVIRNVSGKLIAVEAKSTKTAFFPKYNGGGVKRNYVYIFSNEIENATVIYMGSDIVSPEQYELHDELNEKIHKLYDEYNIRIGERDTNNRGFGVYFRKDTQQSGGAEKTNYFTHQNKDRDKQNVLDFVS
jgi:hypothetical protein